jgi:ribonuclease HI
MLEIYTDGSAIGNPGHGGWGAVILDGKTRRYWWQRAKGPKWPLFSLLPTSCRL